MKNSEQMCKTVLWELVNLQAQTQSIGKQTQSQVYNG